jgi:hypothetical protein
MAVEWRFLGSEEQRNRPRVRSAISGDSLWKHYTSLYYTEMNFEQLTSSIGSHFSVSECFFVGMDPVWTCFCQSFLCPNHAQAAVAEALRGTFQPELLRGHAQYFEGWGWGWGRQLPTGLLGLMG